VPLVEMTIPTGSIAPEARAALTDELRTLMLRAERAPDTEFFRSITWVQITEVDSPGFVVRPTVPEGALSERRKAELVESFTKAIMEAAALGEGEGLRVWVIVNEVPDGNWGAGGQVIRFAQLREMALQEREGSPAGA
jgi:phenylpyruvate tautomerase PptA (4-oxalocrotonate tautomerase family)